MRRRPEAIKLRGRHDDACQECSRPHGQRHHWAFAPDCHRDEAAPKLIVDPPLPEPLSRGLVFIQYRAENIRIVPVFGDGPLQVSPRIGHVNVTVDDLPWHFVDASGETLIVVGLPAGEHKVLVELAEPRHRVITAETVRFFVPEKK